MNPMELAELEDLLDVDHECDDEGFGCETEEFYFDFGFRGESKYSRCRLRREALEKFEKELRRYASKSKKN